MDQIKETEYPDHMAAIWYIGQMGLVIKWKGTIIYIDPVLNELFRPDGISRRLYPPPYTGQMVDRVDWVICSHNHADHMNADTLKPMWENNRHMRVVVPYPVTKVLECSGIPEHAIVGAKEFEPVSLTEEIQLLPVGAAHESYETDTSGNQCYLGYFLDLGGIRIYHSGDTMLTERLLTDIKNKGPITAAFLPVNGTDLERRGRGIVGNMDGRDAAYLAAEAGVDLVVPLHYDMVEGNTENPLLFAFYMEELYPGRKYEIMKLGQRLIGSFIFALDKLV